MESLQGSSGSLQSMDGQAGHVFTHNEVRSHSMFAAAGKGCRAVPHLTAT